VIGAGNDFCLTAALQQLMTTVLADVVESSQLAAFVSAGEDALSLDLGGNITSGLSQFFLMTEKLPAFVENLLALEIKKTLMLVTVGMQRM